MNSKVKYLLKENIIRICLFLFSAVVLIPIIWMIIYSITAQGADTGKGLEGFFNRITLDGYKQVFQQTPFLLWAVNSLKIAVIKTAGQLIIAFLVAYSLTRFKFPGRNILFYFVLTTMVIPFQALMIPMFITVNELNWVDTTQAVIIPFLASGYSIFLLRQYFMTIPDSLTEAAIIDGCREHQVLAYIYIPSSLPVIGSLGIILLVQHWNEYYWPLIVLSTETKLTLPVALVRFKNEGQVERLPTMAAAAMSVIPVLILYVFAQKTFIEGFVAGGIKG